MVSGQFVVFAMLLFATTHAGRNSRKKCQKFLSSNCTALKTSPVCGTDFKTYQNMCFFKQKACASNKLKVKYRAKCSNNLTSCQKKRHQNTGSMHAPFSCNKDGSYEQTQYQIIDNKEYRFCLTPNGTVLSAEMTNGERISIPSCDSYTQTRDHKVKECELWRWPEFANSSLLYMKDYYRNLTGISYMGVLSKIKGMLFKELDKDEDGFLDKVEAHDFSEYLARKFHPLMCSKRFMNTCDFNKDDKYSSAEWQKCFMPTLYADMLTLINTNAFNQPGIMTSGGDQFDIFNGRPSKRDFTCEPQGLLRCRNGIPERTQCFKSNEFKYCFCVHRNGTHIPDSYTNGAKPNCDTMDDSFKDKCVGDVLTTFKANLYDFIKAEYLESKNATEKDGMKRIVDWKFLELDKDKNSVLDKVEFRKFGRQIKSHTKLFADVCRRKFKRRCELFFDDKVTFREFFNCFK